MEYVLRFVVVFYCVFGSYAQDVCSDEGVCDCSTSDGRLTVDCSGQRLTSIPNGIPNDTQILNLENNWLQIIPENAFKDLPHLIQINLNENFLQTQSLTGALFEPLVSLQTLLLTNNRLQSLDESLYSVFSRLKLLDLANNVFVCNCDMLWMRNWLLNKFPSDLPTVVNAKCSSPAYTADLDIAVAEFCLQNPSCYICSGASSNTECNRQGVIECGDSETACQNEIQIENGVYSITKRCQSLTECVVQSYQNYDTCIDGDESLCLYCCQGNQCNELGKAHGVMAPTTVPPIVYTTPSSDCEHPGNSTSAVNCTYLHAICNHTITDLIGLNCTDDFSENGNGGGYEASGNDDGEEQDNVLTEVTTQPIPLTTNLTTLSPGLSTITLTLINMTITDVQNLNISVNGSDSSETVSHSLTTCPEETLTNSKGTFIWPEAEGNTSLSIECPYNPGNYSTRNCLVIPDSNEIEWGVMNTTNCAYQSVLNRELHRLYSTQVTAENAESISSILMDMTSSPNDFTQADVNLVVNIMENLAENIAVYENSSQQVMQNVMESASQMAQGVNEKVLYDGEEASQSSTRILQNIDQFARDVSINETEFGLSTITFNVAILDVDDTYQENVVFVGDPDSQVNILNNSTDYTSLYTSINIPESLFQSVVDPIWRCQFVIFTDTIYFDIIGHVVNQSMDITGQAVTFYFTNSTDELMNETISEPVRSNVLNSFVISASIGDLQIEDLLEPVVVTFVHKQVDNVGNPKCVFWNFTENGGLGGWSTDGCSVNSTNDTNTVCQCNHLTNFALLMDIYGDTAELPEEHQLALSYISYIGCGLSILGLALTLLTYACCSLHYPKGDPRRKTKADKRVKILLNLVLSLLMTNIFFIMSSLTVEFEDDLGEVCRIMAIFLHYFLLSTMAWMALEAFNMYLSLVKVFEQYYSHFLLKQMVFGWGIPIIFIIVTVSININHYGLYNRVCWLDRSAFYWAFMVPIVVILIFNFVIFTMVMKQLCNLRHTKITKTERFTAWSHLRGSISLMVLLGLTWVLAVFAVSEASLVFSYLFAILNSFQGLSIFIFHCLAKKDIRFHWRKLCCPCCIGHDDELSSGFGSSIKYRSNTKRQRITWSTDARNHTKTGGPSAKTNGNTVSHNTNSHTVSEYNSRGSGKNGYSNGTVFSSPLS